MTKYHPPKRKKIGKLFNWNRTGSRGRDRCCAGDVMNMENQDEQFPCMVREKMGVGG